MSLSASLLPEAAADIEELAAKAGQHSVAARTNFLLAVTNKVQLIE